MTRFSGRHALITAASKGIGLGIAQRLAREGAQVTAIGRSPASLAAAQADPNSDGIRFVQADLSDRAATEAVMAGLLEDGRGFDVLVNNAGGSLGTPQLLADETEDDWARVLDLNVLTTMRVSRAVLPGMCERGYGRIVNMSSKAARYGSLFTGSNYAAAKGAVMSMTLQFAQEFGPRGVTCNAVCPGAILTERLRGLLAERMTPEKRAEVEAAIPMRRHGEVEDVAAAVAFLASDEAGFITGQMLDINGGQGMST
ncbi:SDR family NAD(P)-dependent oxidoreductase [Defluviimonas sp. SAOS-178_SWC]|uniref:SDR family NAD(P)-dependent oxidoreductase n=1 Tax=Defluviimonas sp. SAOS-178_SWC TaxID=3121287 RepID=UPI003221DB39